MNTPDITDDETNHRENMDALQAEMKKKMNAAQEKRGLLIVNTGDGKGKSTAAFGVLTRTLAYGGKAVVIQFIKQSPDAVEKVLRSDNLTWHAVGGGFTWDTKDKAADIALCEKGWALAEAAMGDPDVQLVVLDEFNIVLCCKYLATDRVLLGLAKKQADQHVIVTGRDSPAGLIEMADLVTEMKEVKHPFTQGVKAQRGIEF